MALSMLGRIGVVPLLSYNDAYQEARDCGVRRSGVRGGRHPTAVDMISPVGRGVAGKPRQTQGLTPVADQIVQLASRRIVTPFMGASC
jgi:hypothetical protein